MSNDFFEKPILNFPYACPARHWELDETGQPTQRILETRCVVALYVFVMAQNTFDRHGPRRLCHESLHPSTPVGIGPRFPGTGDGCPGV